jgi:hypothetical protein
MESSFPYDCKVYSGKELRNNRIHTVICEFDCTNIDEEEKRRNICEVIKKGCIEKHVWALYGSDNQDNWICLQVASKDAEDVVSEILYDIESMHRDNSNKERSWRSKFHANVFKANYEYICLDIIHQKYQLMKDKFAYLMIVIINSNCLLTDREVGDLGSINKYAEVKYACGTEPLFWNAFGKEHMMVEILSTKNR